MINLKDVEEVGVFCYTVEHLKGDFTIRSGRYTVNASSIVGILSLDLARPLALTCEGCDKKQVLKQLDCFLAKGRPLNK